MICNDSIKSIEYQGNTFFIKWYLTDVCNYHCPYCLHTTDLTRNYNYGHNQKEIEDKAKQITKILISNNVKKPLWLRLMGGEATIFELIPIIDNIDFPISNIGLVTNFYRPLDYFINLYKYCSNRKISLHLTLSYHEENKTFFDKALELTLWCRDNGYKDPEINLVVTNDLDIDLINKYKAKGLVRFRATKARKAFGILFDDLSEDRIEWLNELNKSTRKNSQSKGKYLITYYDGTTENRNSISDYVGELDKGGFITDGRPCSMGVDAIFIRSDDNIYRGCCGYLSADIIGNIWDDNFKIPTEDIICRINQDNPEKNYRCIPCYHLRIGEVIKDEI